MKNKLKRASDGAGNGWIMSLIIYGGGSAVEVARSSRSIPLYMFYIYIRFWKDSAVDDLWQLIIVYTMWNFKELVFIQNLLVYIFRVLLTPFLLQSLRRVRQSSLREAFVTCKLFINTLNCDRHKREKSPSRVVNSLRTWTRMPQFLNNLTQET